MPLIGLPAGPAGTDTQASSSTSAVSSPPASPGVDDRARLEQKHRGLGIGPRTVLDTTRDDEQLPRPEHRIAVWHLNGEPSAEDQEELVGVGVPVPGELAPELHDPDVVVVDLGNLLRPTNAQRNAPASRPDSPPPWSSLS
jgi:hypothetical protein